MFRNLGLKKSINVLITLVERLFLNIFLRIEQGADHYSLRKKFLLKLIDLELIKKQQCSPLF